MLDTTGSSEQRISRREQGEKSKEANWCEQAQFEDWKYGMALGISRLANETCTDAGVLVQPSFMDMYGRDTVETRTQENGEKQVNLLRQGVSLTLDKDGHLLSYSNKEHLYAFDVSKQIALTEERQKLFRDHPFEPSNAS